MAYTYATNAQALADLAARLYDTTSQQWSLAELLVWLNEALRTWNALTSTWRQDQVVPLLPNTNWYDLSTLAGTPRPYTVTDHDLLEALEYHLLEPLTAVYPLVWSGSTQFTVQDLLDALGDRRNETLGASNPTITRILIPALISTTAVLPDNVIGLRRVTWLPVAGSGYSPVTLVQADLESKADYDWGYTVAPPEPPSAWLQNAEPPLTFTVDRVPPCPGQYECLVVQAGGAFSTAAATLLRIPDDWSWVVKWGALACLLGREGNAKDSLRAEYAARRFADGLSLLVDAPIVLGGRINNLPCSVDSVRNGDDFAVGWQAAGVPSNLYTIGNLVGATSPLVAATYSATLSVVTNAPLDPVFVQVSRDNYDAIIDYAQHLASFKMGGAEFAATLPLLQSFIKQASLFNDKLGALGDYQKIMYEITHQEDVRNPVYSGPGPRSTQ
jgi:hypothetical protein